jgi:hypothetical protein
LFLLKIASDIGPQMNELLMKKLPCYFSIESASPELIAQIHTLGIHMAKSGNIKNEFSNWADAYLTNP